MNSMIYPKSISTNEILKEKLKKEFKKALILDFLMIILWNVICDTILFIKQSSADTLYLTIVMIVIALIPIVFLNEIIKQYKKYTSIKKDTYDTYLILCKDKFTKRSSEKTSKRFFVCYDWEDEEIYETVDANLYDEFNIGEEILLIKFHNEKLSKEIFPKSFLNNITQER